MLGMINTITVVDLHCSTTVVFLSLYKCAIVIVQLPILIYFGPQTMLSLGHPIPARNCILVDVLTFCFFTQYLNSSLTCF